jgi:hypothetical protein
VRRMDFWSSNSSATKMSRFTTVLGENGVTRSVTRSLHERRPTLADLAQVSRHRAMFRSPFGHGHRPGEHTCLESLRLSVNGILHVDSHAARDVERRSRVSRLDLRPTGPVSGAALFGFLAAMVVLETCFSSSTNEFPDAAPSPALSDGASGTPGINAGRVGYRQPGALPADADDHGDRELAERRADHDRERGGEGQRGPDDFWTYTCINCIRKIPGLRNWQFGSN